MVTYNQLIQDELSTLNDYDKSHDLISNYGSIYKKLNESDIVLNQKELLSFPLWNNTSQFVPNTASVTINVNGPDPSYSAWQFKYGFTDEELGSQYFGLHPNEKKYFLSQSLGYVIDEITAATDFNHNNVLFYYGYGNYDGSGSQKNTIDATAPAEILNSTPSKILYRSIRNQILDTDGKLKMDDSTEINDFFYIKIPRQIYKEKLLKKSLQLTLSGTNNISLQLTDDGTTNYNPVDTNPIVPIISGTLQTYYTGSENAGGGKQYSTKIYYGIFDTNNGYIILNAEKVGKYFASNGSAIGYTTASNTTLALPSYTYDGNSGGTLFKYYVNLRGFATALYSGSIKSPFLLKGLETYTYDTYYVNVGAYDFNRSSNPTYLTGSNLNTFKPNLLQEDFVYITTIGLYNDDGDLLAIAKLSKPILKKRGDAKLFKINISI
jgi:hypothetical protein